MHGWIHRKPVVQCRYGNIVGKFLIKTFDNHVPIPTQRQCDDDDDDDDDEEYESSLDAAGLTLIVLHCCTCCYS